ncbi:MAG: CxxxxCH/CxxCH domain-containing protein [Ignavibacterium sp.]|nr:CxxxxCH/CxxCH domain-containing protein [Ignavibacterium sp.]MCX7610957.1 CxxxxCH/CxxCH domain-containing protein [Ignavibacterium sp.]MDW8375888.1 CxxxxCH/CxxCH domain-containing protein [Ignavibacteriales bacterium]
MKKTLLIISVLSFLFLSFTACSEMNKDLPSSVSVNIHKPGINNPNSPNFHGKLVAATDWTMRECQQCHGRNYQGGIISEASGNCLTCHTQSAGPEACNTCHGDFSDSTKIAPPRALDGSISPSSRGVGAHVKHLYAATSGKKVECNECHLVPAMFLSAGHFDNTPRSEVVFGDLTKTKTNEPNTTDYDASLQLFSPNPSYNYETNSCSNTYCHGYFKNGNTDYVVSFTAGSDGAKCGTCHGNKDTGNSLPKTSAQGGTHPNVPNCEFCHAGVVALVSGKYVITDSSKHINGKLNIFGQERDY